MNREDGFPIADVDVGLFHDPKVIALVRQLRDERQTATHLAIYAALVLESWAAGDRVPLSEALPAWWMGPADDIETVLRSVGLIDDESRIPTTAWSSWYVPAFDRRERRRASGAEGGRRSWESRRDKRRRSDASAAPNPSDRPAGRPSGRQAGRDDSPAPFPERAGEPSGDACALCPEPIEAAEPRTMIAGRGDAHVACAQQLRGAA